MSIHRFIMLSAATLAVSVSSTYASPCSRCRPGLPRSPRGRFDQQADRSRRRGRRCRLRIHVVRAIEPVRSGRHGRLFRRRFAALAGIKFLRNRCREGTSQDRQKQKTSDDTPESTHVVSLHLAPGAFHKIDCGSRRHGRSAFPRVRPQPSGLQRRIFRIFRSEPEVLRGQSLPAIFQFPFWPGERDSLDCQLDELLRRSRRATTCSAARRSATPATATAGRAKTAVHRLHRQQHRNSCQSAASIL
jgi:hypothetical protein